MVENVVGFIPLPVSSWLTRWSCRRIAGFPCPHVPIWCEPGETVSLYRGNHDVVVTRRGTMMVVLA